MSGPRFRAGGGIKLNGSTINRRKKCGPTQSYLLISKNDLLLPFSKGQAPSLLPDPLCADGNWPTDGETGAMHAMMVLCALRSLRKPAATTAKLYKLVCAEMVLSFHNSTVTDTLTKGS